MIECVVTPLRVATVPVEGRLTAMRPQPPGAATAAPGVDSKVQEVWL